MHSSKVLGLANQRGPKTVCATNKVPSLGGGSAFYSRGGEGPTPLHSWKSGKIHLDDLSMLGNRTKKTSQRMLLKNSEVVLPDATTQK